MRELSLHILDIARNSLEAGATRVEITVREDTRKNWLHMEIKDNGRGMDEEEAKKAADPFYTTRKTRRVGLGLSLLKANALACGGSFTIISQPGSGTVVSALFQWNHIDRAPLGDMPSTLTALIQGSPHVDFYYCHEFDGRSFCLDTAEIREALEGLPLNHPEILNWLQDFLKEKEKEVLRAFHDLA
ncbi:MAG: ATP-binding protein [Peptococcaceae bacterium]|jgi:hypothetical protein|nr:ATP-binding protein [Peptococcaceae bacterium]MDH7524236.1 ATP-binding protein [Peptococcaceae bacterium]